MVINKIYNEDCYTGLKKLPENSIDCCISSPPYWALRDYGIDGQLGQEDDYIQFVLKLTEIYKEVFRALKPTGTCFVNLGDTYGIHKCLSMIPERFAIKMIDYGWILRNQIIWHKPNQMPSSASDRFTVDFEKIFFFVKQSKGYYFEQQLEPYTKPMNRWGGDNLDAKGESRWDDGTSQTTYRNRNMRPNPDGKNMRTVWSINTKPFSDAHFAVFPETLIERMIKAGCPKDGIVLDPFMGAGTTAVTARKLNRNYIGYELNPEYIKIADKRLYNELGMWR